MAGALRVFFGSAFGWLKSVAHWIWAAIFNVSSSNAIDWLGDNWLACVVLVCILGMIVDWTVHLARWRPDIVYRSFFRRLFRVTSNGNAENRGSRRKGSGVAGMGKAALESIRKAVEYNDEDDLSYHPASLGINSDKAYNAPYVPAQWKGSDGNDNNGRAYAGKKQ